VASGLTLIFGVMRIINFAHGAIYMLGAYFAFAVASRFGDTTTGFLAAVIIAPVGGALLGVVIERAFLRPIYHRPHLEQLLLTFALVLIFIDGARMVWGVEFKSVGMPGFLSGSVSIVGRSFPVYYFFVWAIAIGVAAGLWLLVFKSRAGIFMRATVQDEEMAAALGINTQRVYMCTFILGAYLASLGGALMAPLRAIGVHLATESILEAFIIVIVGGLGSVFGALVGALILGQANAFGALVAPRLIAIFPFVLMVIVLILRPYGLFGRKEGQH
jgi:branched-chain amino acid transport system permease protein